MKWDFCDFAHLGAHKMRFAHCSTEVFICLFLQYKIMYLLNDVRSYTYKLTPVIQDQALASKLRDHKESKARQFRDFNEFKKVHGHRYEGLEFRLLRTPALSSPLPEDQFHIRLLVKKVKRAIHLLYVKKNELTDARYYIRRRVRYLGSLKKHLKVSKRQSIMRYFKQDLGTFQEVVEFLTKNDLITMNAPDLHLLEKVLASGGLSKVAFQFQAFLPACNGWVNLLKKRIWALKCLLKQVKAKIQYCRYPKEAREFRDDINKKVGYNFFLNRWITNHFIVYYHDLASIRELRNFESNGKKVSKSGQWKVLYNKLRVGFPSTVKTVQILRDRLGTPAHMGDRMVRNALALASNVLKSQEKRLELMQEIHAYFKKHLKELRAFITDEKLPAKLFQTLTDEKYFLVENVLRAYRNGLLTFLKICWVQAVTEATEKEVRAYFEKVFERQFHRALNLFLAHSSKDRKVVKVQESSRAFGLTVANVKRVKKVGEALEAELDRIDFEGFIRGFEYLSLSKVEREEFIKFLRWLLVASFLLNKVKTQCAEEKFNPSLKALESFQEHSYLMEVPLVSQDVILFHADDGERRQDDAWNLPKIAGRVSEITNLNGVTTEKLRFRWKLLQEDGTWKFEEFEAKCPELRAWFRLSDFLKRFLKEIVHLLGYQEDNGFFKITSPDLGSFREQFDSLYNEYRVKITDVFHVHLFDQLRLLILERFEKYRENPSPKTFKKFNGLILDKVDTQTLHQLLKVELKRLDPSNFGRDIQRKIEILNREGLPLERVNITNLKRIFLAHMEECPPAIRWKFRLCKLKDYVLQRSHTVYWKNGKVLLVVPIEIQVPITPNESKRITGMDWGIRKDATMSILDYGKLEFVEDMELEEPVLWGKVITSRGNVARLQRAKANLEQNFLEKGRFYKPHASQIAGHGAKNKARLKQLAHSVSTKLIEWSVASISKVLAVESLKSLRPVRGELSRLLNFRISHSPRADMKRLMSEKIRRYGGKLYHLNARYTSQYSSELILQALKANGHPDEWYAGTTKGYRTNDTVTDPPPKEVGGEYFYHAKVPIIKADVNSARIMPLKLLFHFK